MFKKLLSAVAIVLASVATAQAYIPTSTLVARFIAQYDGDRNGEVSRAEFLASAEARFRQLDLNGDGRVSAQEADTVFGKLNGSAW
jgi:Ca2+-binding EF-hand superfamily protein